MSKRNKEKVTEKQFSSYDLFVAVLSVLSIVNIFLFAIYDAKNILYVIGIVDTFLSIIFFSDFIHRLFTAQSKAGYFLRDFGWADLLASIPLPQLKILRLFRIVKAYRVIKQVGPDNVAREFFKNRAASALYVVLFSVILLLEFGSMAILSVESTVSGSNIKTASDAIWWVYVTITTVGYGDKYPITNSGRAIGMLIMFVGVGLFGVLTGFLANKFLSPQEKTENTNSDLQKIQDDLNEIKTLLKTSVK